MLRLARAQLSLHRPAIMAIVNCTPDSFSDGGSLLNPQEAVRHALNLIDQGAAIIDIGGISTRPGSQAVDEAEEARRIIPVIAGLRAKSDIIISVDTYRASVARLALEAGADIINDICAGRDEDMLALAAEKKAALVLMHMQGTPAVMQYAPSYEDVTAEVEAFFLQRIAMCRQAGIHASSLLLDPGIGFGKSAQHNLEIMRNLSRFAALGYPLLLGVSRKSFLSQLSGETFGGVGANLAANLWGLMQGVNILRVHEVEPLQQACKVIAELKASSM